MKGSTKSAMKGTVKSASKPSKMVKGDPPKNGDWKKRAKEAKELMKESERKKKFAAKQESLGRGQIRNGVKGPMIHPTLGDLPVGEERIEIANRLKEEARRDSLKAVKLYPPNASGGAASASKSSKRFAIKGAMKSASKSSKMAKGKSSKKGY